MLVLVLKRATMFCGMIRGSPDLVSAQAIGKANETAIADKQRRLNVKVGTLLAGGIGDALSRNSVIKSSS